MISTTWKVLSRRWDIARLSISHHRQQRSLSYVLRGNTGLSATFLDAISPKPASVFIQAATLESVGYGAQFTQVRGKKNKAGRMGQHLKRLDEMAHEKAHDEAVERRKERKQKKANRKEKKGHHVSEDEEEETDSKTASGSVMEFSTTVDDESFDELEEENLEDGEDEGLLPDSDKVKDQMKKIVDSFSVVLKKIRGAEPTPEMFDEVQVEVYGATTNLQSVAQVVISTPTRAEATCFDPATAKNVCKAIQVSMGLNPSVEEGGTVRIPLPRVSMETREKTAKALNKRTESYRQRIRKVRRKSMDIIKEGVAGKLEHVSKDEAFRVQQEVEKEVESALAELNELAQKKHDSIMKV